MARYVIGDIHGCGTEFEQLLAKINFNPAQDKLYLVGDLVGRGTEPSKVIRLAKELNATVTLGNFDLQFLAVYFGAREDRPGDNFAEFFSLPKAEQEELITWLKTRPFVVEDKYFWMVHAALPMWIPKAEILHANQSLQQFFSQMTPEQWITYFKPTFLESAHAQADLAHFNLEGLRCFEGISWFTITRQLQRQQPDQVNCFLNLSPVDFNQKLATLTSANPTSPTSQSTIDQAADNTDLQTPEFPVCYAESKEPLAQALGSISELNQDYWVPTNHKEFPIYDSEVGNIPWYELEKYLQEQGKISPAELEALHKLDKGLDSVQPTDFNSVLKTSREPQNTPTTNPEYINLCAFLPSKPVYFGHWSRLAGIELPPGYICTDNSCVYGGALCAYLLPEKEISDPVELLKLATPVASVPKIHINNSENSENSKTC